MRGDSPISSAEEELEQRLDRRRRHLDVGQLVENRHVAEAAEQDAAVRELLPVIEALARVVRPVVEDAVERLGHDHLAARRPDRLGELAHETVPVAVGGDDDLVCVEHRRRRRRARARATRRPPRRRARRACARTAPAGSSRRAHARSRRRSGRRACRGGRRASRRRSRPRAAPRTRRESAPAPPRRRRGGSCRPRAARPPRARRAGRPPSPSSASSSRACSRPYVSRAMS